MFGAKRDRATAQKWFSKGLEYFDTQQFSQACRAFQAAVAAYPDNGEYHFYLACSLYSTNMAMEAEQEFYRALELSANNPDYYAAFAIFYLQQNLPQMAREMFAKVRDIDPNHSTLAEYKDFLTRKRSS
jgi:Flp pilus assembly protein TadD